jgi:hypothetical protein
VVNLSLQDLFLTTILLDVFFLINVLYVSIFIALLHVRDLRQKMVFAVSGLRLKFLSFRICKICK